jgi:hypothetical protein
MVIEGFMDGVTTSTLRRWEREGPIEAPAYG